MKHLRGLFTVTLGICTAITLFAPTAESKVIIEDIKNNVIPVEFNTAIGSEYSKEGETVRVTLIDELHYKGQVLPKNMVLEGRVQKVRPSRRMGQPGYTRMIFEKAYLDEHSDPIELQPVRGEKPSSQIPYRPKKKLKGMALYQAPIVVIPEAISIPISIVHHAAAWEAYLIDLASELGTAVTQEVYHRKENGKSFPKAVAYGAFRSTNIPFVMGLAKKAPNVDYAAGAVSDVQLEHKFLENLFKQVAEFNGNDTSGLLQWQTNQSPTETVD